MARIVAVFTGPEGKLHVPAFPVKAVDSTGAGDAFIAAFAAGWAKGIDIERSLRYACAAGALATTRVGAQAALPSVFELEEAMRDLLSGKISSERSRERE